jgi:large subunit ribosomal protein L9
MANDTIIVKLLKRIAGIGIEWAIVEVARAQARNFLIPKGFAVVASEALLAAENAKKKKIADNRIKNIEESAQIAAKLHTKEIHLSLRGKGTTVYGGIAEHEIISAIKREYGVELEKKNILLPNGSHIKKTGSFDIKIHITEDSYIRMAVIVSLID